jgi:Protein of unknown function (DUF4065)
MTDLERDKFKNLMHHVIWKTQDRDGWGLTKLFKVLWFFEARRFTLANERFSNAEYVRDEHGPRPKLAYQFLKELERQGAIRQYEEPYHRVKLRRAQALQTPRPGLLNAEQAQVLDQWISYIDGKSAAEISAESHDYGWEIAEQGDNLPLHAILASRVRDPKGKELDWARGIAKDLKLP